MRIAARASHAGVGAHVGPAQRLVHGAAAAVRAQTGHGGHDAVLQDSQAEWEYTLPSDAAEVTLLIKDGEQIVARAEGETTTGNHTFNWDGLSDSGSQLDDGIYTLEIIAEDAEGEALQTSIRAAARVTGVDMSGNEVSVQMGSISVPLSSILSVREAPSTAQPPTEDATS